MGSLPREVLKGNAYCRNTQPKCEPRLGKRGLYGSTGGSQPEQREHAMLRALSMSDRNHWLLDISTKSGIGFDVVRAAASWLSGFWRTALTPRHCEIRELER